MLFLNQFLTYLYHNKDHKFDLKITALAEEVLGESLTFFNGLLEDPNIWTSDFDPLGGDLDANS